MLVRPRTAAHGRGLHPATMVSAALVGGLLGVAVGGWAAPLFVLLGLLVVAVSEPDLRERRIPNRTLVVFAPAMALALAVAGTGAGEPLRIASTLGWVGFCLVLFSLAAAAVPGGLGMGDVKLLAVSALALGWLGSGAVLGAAAIAFGSAGVAGLVARRRGRWTAGVPFAPFHAVGVVVVVLGAGATP